MTGGTAHMMETGEEEGQLKWKTLSVSYYHDKQGGDRGILIPIPEGAVPTQGNNIRS